MFLEVLMGVSKILVVHRTQRIGLKNVKCQNLLRAIENLGIAVVYGIRYYGQGNITEDNYVQFIKHDTISSEYLNQSRNFVQHVR